MKALKNCRIEKIVFGSADLSVRINSFFTILLVAMVDVRHMITGDELDSDWMSSSFSTK